MRSESRNHVLLLLCASLLCAARAEAAWPPSPKGADLVLYAPSARPALANAKAFLEVAGRHSPSLRPEVWGRALGGALGIDAMETESFAGAGLDPDAALSAYAIDGALVACLGVKDFKKVSAIAEQGLKLAGQVEHRKEGSFTLGLAHPPGEPKQLARAWALSRQRICAFVSGSNGLRALKLAAQAGGGSSQVAASPRPVAGLSGDFFLLAPMARAGAVGLALRPSAQGMDLEGKVVGPNIASAFRDMEALQGAVSSAPLFLRAGLRLDQGLGSQLFADAARNIHRMLCQTCAPAAADALAKLLASELSGDVALVLSGLNPALAAGPGGSYLVLEHGLLARAKSPERMGKGLALLAAQLSAAGVAATFDEQAMSGSAPLGAGRLHYGLKDGFLYMANSDGARTAVLAALEKPASEARPLGFLAADLRPKELARVLFGVSMLDAAKSPELAAAFAAAVEIGPLLKASGDVELRGAKDPWGIRFSGRWPLESPKSPPAAESAPAQP